VIELKNEAEVAGLRTAVQGFTSAANFAQYHVLQKLAPALTEIFAGDDSDFARLFAAYMSRPVESEAGPAEPAKVAEPTPEPAKVAEPMPEPAKVAEPAAEPATIEGEID
jgi:hypothetical protein